MIIKTLDPVNDIKPGNRAATVGSTPAQLREVIFSEASRWRRVIQENGIKLEE